MRRNGTKTRGYLSGARAAVLALAAVMIAAAGAAAADPPGSPKLQRQIDVFEQILNQVLVDSPNFLVPGRNAARGLYLEEFGILFTFNASLVDKKSWGEDWGWGNFKVQRDGDKIVIITGDDEDKQDAEKMKEHAEQLKQQAENWKQWMEQRREQDRELYEAGKVELIHMLMDYGSTMTQLEDDQWVAVAAFLGDRDFFEHEGISHLVLKAKMSDLRAHAADRLDDKGLESRIVVEEY